MKVSIVIPFYRNYDTILNLLRSIEDQDYKKIDITVVQDGKDEEAEKLLKELGKDFKFQYLILEENGGASRARNYGASKTDGEILFFIDGDCELYPGMVSECISQFNSDEKIAFVFGNYRFEDKYEYHSKGFDPYLLETMNYINTMSPMKREAFNAVNGFMEDQTFFQDWSLFYRLAKKGFIGKYINEFIFTTKLSNEDNISGSQGMTLAEKCKKFRKYHKIKNKKIVCTTFAAPLQAIQRAKMLGADYVGPSKDSRQEQFPVNFQFDNWKATYMVGCFNHPIEALENHYKVIQGKPIFHFIGTDVFQLYNKHPMVGLKDISESFKLMDAKLFVNSSRMQQELKDCGIKADLLYTPIYKMEQYTWADLPERFIVGVYFSDSNPMHMLDGAGGHSNIPLIMDVARSTPDIQYKFFGGNAKYCAEDLLADAPENIEFCGRIPEDKMVEFIHGCSAIIRSTIHDGFPQLPIQFMLCGRDAIVSVPDPEFRFAYKLKFETILNYEEAKTDMINALYLTRTHQQGYILHRTAHEYYGELMSEDKFREEIYKCVK